MKKLFLLILVFLTTCFSNMSYSHQVVGEVAPLLSRMEIILRMIEAGKKDSAFRETEEVVEDFHNRELALHEEGLKTTMGRMDKKFGTDLQTSLDESIANKQVDSLQKTLQTLGFLLMLEKFDALQEMNKGSNLEAQKAIFWLGRNYFSLIIEPTLAKYDPALELRMDRLLDRALYRLEDGRWDEFRAAMSEFLNEMTEYFGLSLPPSVLNKSKISN